MFFFIARMLGVEHRRIKIETSLTSRLRKMLLFLLLLIALHVIAMLVFEQAALHKRGDESSLEVFVNSVWLTLTTVLTIGYGDISAATIPGKVATMLLLYTGAVFMVANVASAAVEMRLEKLTRMRDGTWRWKLRDHILILNSPAKESERYFVSLIELLRREREFTNIPVMILTERFTNGLPDGLRDLGAVFYHGSPHDLKALQSAGADKAKYIVLLAEEETHPRSDSLNFDVLLELHETYTNARIISEVVEDSSRERFRRFGAHRIVRPVRSYPEFIVRALACPGSETVVEDILSSEGSVTQRFNVRIDNRRWADIGATMLLKGYGTVLGYVDEQRKVVSNPAPLHPVSGRGLFVLVRTDNPPSRSQVQAAIDGLGVEAR
ncbi:potassium channel family protein [Smaragdicoccus niigatensis]|uniref:potassium channel family protein n=1 Tax=Smaragdicoccus niigatensis TaxID=359359 RepID=UPI00035ED29F|nr:potassium channel family protein [Smaragdicoccus niigatensis]